MNEERKKILNKVNELIDTKKKELLEKMPDVHEIDDGIVIRSFNVWDNCDDNQKIRYKHIKNLDNPNEIIVFFFLPKDTFFELKKREFIKGISCLEGKLELKYDNLIRVIESGTKIIVDNDMFEGRALEDTYLVTINRE